MIDKLLGKRVTILWEDCAFDARERAVKELPLTFCLETVGQVVQISDTHISIASEKVVDGDDDRSRQITSIPFSLVKEIAPLSKGKPIYTRGS